MARYVDGYLIPIPKKNLPAYRRMAAKASKVWCDHGALEYFECVGDDLTPKWGLPFPRLLKVRRGETVLYSFVVYKSRKHRDTVNARVMKDPRLAAMMGESKMPFDMKRMSYGGFTVLVEA